MKGRRVVKMLLRSAKMNGPIIVRRCEFSQKSLVL